MDRDRLPCDDHTDDNSLRVRLVRSVLYYGRDLKGSDGGTFTFVWAFPDEVMVRLPEGGPIRLTPACTCCRTRMSTRLPNM